MKQKSMTAPTTLKFIGRVTKMGEYRIIRIPKRYQEIAEKFGDNYVRVTVDDEIL